MPRGDHSASDSQENESNSSSEELETRTNGGIQKVSEYEKQRMKRIEENRSRMEALGLRKMVSSFLGSVRKTMKNVDRKGKQKVDEEDEEYRPPERQEGLTSSSEEGEDNDFEDEELSGVKSSRSRKPKANRQYTIPRKKISVQNFISNSDFVDDDDEELMQAIALSLHNSAKCLDVADGQVSQSSDKPITDGNERKGNSNIKDDTSKRKRKKLVSSRLQMTEDELVLHFYQLDEAGKGSINLRDLRRVAVAHDFTWTDKEMDDMIHYFDSDGDGKLSLDDFRKIVGRCNMLQGVETSIPGSKV